MATSGEVDKLVPLSAPMLHILLALGHQRLHGYGIMQSIAEKTDGRARILPGTLYTTLNRMLAKGLLEEASPPGDAPDDDRRRSYYQVTAMGHEVVAAESERMSVLLEVARRNLRAR